MRQPRFGILAGILGAVLGAVTLPAFDFRAGCGDCWAFRHHRHHPEPHTASTLKTITSAQADFRANDRDGDGVNQFWRADIAGLYALTPGGGPAIRLIERSLAMADARPKYEIGAEGERGPLKGYWFRALLHEDEMKPDPNRFAACAFPDSPSAGKWTYIVDEENTIYRKEVKQQRGIDRYPKDPLKEGWGKLD